ncbi:MULTISPECIES: hypothetical protein [unclassified Chryseobacterium]|uniref:hypothetical protein n=1 Tax=unclassified Chryseobacterium TaxID=2593645 RepID=UPI000D3BD96E|nr:MULTISPECIES: hypothetical protein [unclassified Chryseobacterium]PTT74454.1 hypothetical protein DBR25_10835 [Chryseobacterium sp. HMWF001]PVV53557.1 hypothetical protein DD829_18820 [Chryseobacterium sp. HMWF035]
MYAITKKIQIVKKATVSKDTFINDEISPSAELKFICCNCTHENLVNITPYESGFPVFQLYHENKILSINDLLKNSMIKETQKNMLHAGEFTFNDLPTLYFGTDCGSCGIKYIVIFSYGEKQPGLEILSVSGIWEYAEA